MVEGFQAAGGVFHPPHSTLGVWVGGAPPASDSLRVDFRFSDIPGDDSRTKKLRIDRC